MKCIGCGARIDKPAAYALMRAADLKKLKAKPDQQGPGVYHAAAVCGLCHVDPAHRRRVIKAHFAYPADVGRMLGQAGSSGRIRG